MPTEILVNPDDITVFDPDDAPDPDPPSVEVCVRTLMHALGDDCSGMAWLGCYGQVLHMSQFLHMRPKGRRGRQKGSGLKENTIEGFDLWMQGFTEGEIRRKLGLSQEESRRLMARIRSRKRRLPEDERLAAIDAHWEGRSRRKRATAPPCAS